MPVDDCPGLLLALDGFLEALAIVGLAIVDVDAKAYLRLLEELESAHGIALGTRRLAVLGQKQPGDPDGGLGNLDDVLRKIES